MLPVVFPCLGPESLAVVVLSPYLTISIEPTLSGMPRAQSQRASSNRVCAGVIIRANRRWDVVTMPSSWVSSCDTPKSHQVESTSL